MANKTTPLLCLLAGLFYSNLVAQITFVNTSTYYDKPFSRADSIQQCYFNLQEPIEGKMVTIGGKQYLELPILICGSNMKEFGLDAQGRLFYNYTVKKTTEQDGNIRYERMPGTYEPMPLEQFKADSVRLFKSSKKT